MSAKADVLVLLLLLNLVLILKFARAPRRTRVMKRNQQLVQQPAAELELSKTQLRPQELCLLGELALIAENSKTEIGPELQAELVREFGNEFNSTAVLTRTFRTLRRKSNFVPTVKEIHEQLYEEALAIQQQREAERSEKLLAEVKAGREWWAQHPEESAKLSEQCKALEEKLSLVKVPAIRQIDRKHPEWICSQEEWEARKVRAREQARLLMSNFSAKDKLAQSQAGALENPPKKHPGMLGPDAGEPSKLAEKAVSVR